MAEVGREADPDRRGDVGEPMADITSGNCYVDTDNGTDDLSHGTSSGTGACATFAYLWNSRIGTLTGDLVINCAGATDDNIAGFTSTTPKSGTYKISIIGNAKSATWDSSKYTWSVTANSNGVTMKENNLLIKNVQLYYSNSGSYNHLCRLYTTVNGGQIWLDGLYVKRGPLSGTDAIGIRMDAGAATGVHRVWNCIFENWGGSGAPPSGCAGLQIQSGFNFYIYNCTFVDCNNAFWNNDAYTVVGKNLLFVNNTTDCYESQTTLADTYCATTNDNTKGLTPGGTGNRFSQTFTFSDNYHLASTDAGARDHGTSDPGSGLFSDDIDGETRSGTWDIGADEYLAAGRPMYAYAQQ
jgi:hypothetical protein